jgi:hypothetical protein
VTLAVETVVGLKRSNLVKKSSEPPRPNVAAPVAVAPVVAAPVAAAPAAPAPSPAALLTSPSSFEFAPAGLPVPSWMESPAIIDEAPAAPARESFRTKADSIEVEMESQRAPETHRGPEPIFNAAEPVRGPYASSISTNELLERAALEPARMTWESIVLPADPILNEKRTPHVAERRARLTRVVKITLGACLGVCVLALGVSALSGGDSSSSSSSKTAATESVGKSVASKGIVPVEPLDGTKHMKAMRRVAPAATTAAFVRPKHR